MSLEKALDGIQYLPLTRTSYLSVDRLVQAVKENYRSSGTGPVVTHSMVTFEDQLVSSDVRDEDLRAVWKQVVQTSGFDGASAQNSALDRSEAGRKSKVCHVHLEMTACRDIVKNVQVIYSFRFMDENRPRRSSLASHGRIRVFSDSTSLRHLHQHRPRHHHSDLHLVSVHLHHLFAALTV